MVKTSARRVSTHKFRFGGTRRTDREFLPAALEILETPPSPIRMSLMISICGFIVVALLWSYFSSIDIIAVAQGKFQPTGRVKVIQPLETSRVFLTRVENGETVRAGQVLVELDPAEITADLENVDANFGSYRAEIIRRQAAITGVQSRTPPSRLTVAWPQDIPIAIRAREEQVYTADILQLNAQIASIDAQSEQKVAEKQRLRTMIEAQIDLINTLGERVAMRNEAIKLNAGSKSNLIDATEALQFQKTTLAQQKGQLAEAEANMVFFSKEIQRTYDTFVADNAQKLAEAERQAADFAERRVKAEARLSHMTLRAPVDGIVQASTITTVGQVVTSGQELMRIVPNHGALEIECYLLNRDIGFVHAGDHAIIKIEAFPFTRYGTIDATVLRVAHDAIPEPDAEQTARDATRSGQSESQGGGQSTQSLVFPVTLRPTQAFIEIDGARVPLSAGMSVTAEIKTGSRRILEYVFSPVAQVGQEAMKER